MAFRSRVPDCPSGYYMRSNQMETGEGFAIPYDIFITLRVALLLRRDAAEEFANRHRDDDDLYSKYWDEEVRKAEMSEKWVKDNLLPYVINPYDV